MESNVISATVSHLRLIGITRLTKNSFGPQAASPMLLVPLSTSPAQFSSPAVLLRLRTTLVTRTMRLLHFLPLLLAFVCAEGFSSRGGGVTWVWYPLQVTTLLKNPPGGPSHHFQVGNTEDGSYHFGYNTEVGRDRSYREEKRDSSGRVSGSYGYVDPGGVLRVTEYVADEQGFRSTSRETQVEVEVPLSPPLRESIQVIGPIPRPFSALFNL